MTTKTKKETQPKVDVEQESFKVCKNALLEILKKNEDSEKVYTAFGMIFNF